MRSSHTIALILCLVVLTACGQPAPTTTSAPVAQAPTAASTATPRPTDPPPTVTPLPTATPTPMPPTATPTPTLAPTDTPSPSPTPAPAASVTGDSINVRSGPGTVYPVVAQAKKGEALPVVSRTQDGVWLEVTLADGKQGWVSAKLVTLNVPVESLPIAKVIPPTPKPAPTKAAVTPKPTYPTGTIVGRVVDAHGEARIGEKVLLQIIAPLHQPDVPEKTVYSEGDGRFTIRDVPAGSGYLLILGAGPAGRATLMRVNGKVTFSIEPGQTLDVGNVAVP